MRVKASSLADVLYFRTKAESKNRKGWAETSSRKQWKTGWTCKEEGKDNLQPQGLTRRRCKSLTVNTGEAQFFLELKEKGTLVG